ncbi:MAG: putative transcriptional regulator, TetR family [Actinomycetia bacterium]|nr:putative transcriptional regulator, TetR family [Actinomycetes bacterium]
MTTTGIPQPPAPREYSARATEIIAAARAVYEHDGPDALTMRRLGEELGIRAPSLYKHFADKQAVETALIEQSLAEVGAVCHRVVQKTQPGERVAALLRTYREYCVAHPNLYRLATSGPIDRAALTPGLEEWAGSPWFLAVGDPYLAQALWSFAHGMVILEIDGRYEDPSTLPSSWAAGAEAFTAAARNQ